MFSYDIPEINEILKSQSNSSLNNPHTKPKGSDSQPHLYSNQINQIETIKNIPEPSHNNKMNKNNINNLKMTKK